MGNVVKAGLPAQYVAFLSGLHLNGDASANNALRQSFEVLGCRNVRTLLWSGNVSFVAKCIEYSSLESDIEGKLRRDFNQEIRTVVRSMHELKQLELMDPFGGNVAGPKWRMYVTFRSRRVAERLIAPLITLPRGSRIVRMTDGEICSVLDAPPWSRTVDLITFLRERYGPMITTRKWMTIERILAG